MKKRFFIAAFALLFVVGVLATFAKAAMFPDDNRRLKANAGKP